METGKKHYSAAHLLCSGAVLLKAACNRLQAADVEICSTAPTLDCSSNKWARS